jgi:stage V sporulation protein SpoVS
MSKTQIGGNAVDKRTMTASLPVSGDTPVRRLAGAVWKFVQEGYSVDLRAMGAGAISQAVKAAIVTRMMAAGHGKDVHLVPTFEDVVINNETRTLVRFYFLVRSLSAAVPRPGVIDEQA